MACSLILMVYSDFLFLLESQTCQFCCLLREWAKQLVSRPFCGYFKMKPLGSMGSS